ncbi:hypothetical protein [Yaravirus sp. 'brasiliensis']|uniref:Uncharacterized protein n=1 Tax=Yaravirus sp. 'brasiliensis' TaxID=2739681 RepID=A0AAE7B7X1_9VIRU|nr:hypothetical protein QKS73_gp45 [Yaravirus brasiliensis]QKE44432.1 hypothetical protein [Yaravirus brasiliensis]
MGIWDGFRDGVSHNLKEGKEIAVDGIAKVGNSIADALNIPEDPNKKADDAETFDWVLYIAAGVSFAALAMVVIFKFRR